MINNCVYKPLSNKWYKLKNYRPRKVTIRDVVIVDYPNDPLTSTMEWPTTITNSSINVFFFPQNQIERIEFYVWDKYIVGLRLTNAAG